MYVPMLLACSLVQSKIANLLRHRKSFTSSKSISKSGADFLFALFVEIMSLNIKKPQNLKMVFICYQNTTPPMPLLPFAQIQSQKLSVF